MQENAPAPGSQPASNALPEIVSLSYSKSSQVWQVKLAGYPSITVNTNELHNNKRFLKKCMRDLARSFAPTDAITWSQLIDRAMQKGGNS